MQIHPERDAEEMKDFEVANGGLDSTLFYVTGKDCDDVSSCINRNFQQDVRLNNNIVFMLF